MPILALTKRSVESLPHPGRGQVLYRDSQLRGFGLRVGAKSKVWFVEGQVDRLTRRVTIGRADVLAPDLARKQAMTILSAMNAGIDPNRQKRERLADQVTLDEAFDAFFESKPDLSPATVDAYERTRTLYLQSWRPKALQSIARQAVISMHRRISDAPNGSVDRGCPWWSSLCRRLHGQMPRPR